MKKPNQKLKVIVLSVALLISVIQAYSQTYEWSWASGTGNESGDYAYSIKTTENGDIYVAGSFKSASITFGDAISGDTTLYNTSAGSNDIFLVKFNSNKQLLWAICIGGNDSDVASSIDISANGEISLGGQFYSNVIILNNTLSLTNANPAYSNVFLIRLSVDGSILWGLSSNGSNNEVLEDLTVDIFGNTYIVGYYESLCSFGTYQLINNGYYEGFLVKVDTLGNVLNANGFGGSLWDNCKGVTADSQGNIYITGFYRSDIVFGTNTLYNSTGDAHLFVVKYNQNGIVQWVQNSTGTWEVGNEIEVDTFGNVYITGFFQGTEMAIGNLTLTNEGNAGTSDFYAIKLSDGGLPLWLNGGGGSDYEEGRDIDINNQGEVYVAIYFSSPSLTIENINIINNGAGDLLLINYHTSGVFNCLVYSGGDADDQVYSMAVNYLSKVYICGSYASSTISFGNSTLNNAGIADLYIAEASDLTVGIDNSFSTELSIYPNPTNNTLFINNLPENSKIKVFDIFGKEVLNQENINNQIDVSGLQIGIYFMKIENKKGIFTEKFVKQ